MNHWEGKELFEKIKSGDEHSFEILFLKYYKPLCTYAFQFVNEIEEAEEVAQDFFVKLWEKRSVIEIDSSLNNYMFRSIKNHCLNLLLHNNIKNRYSEKIKETANSSVDSSQFFLEPGLAEKIERAINLLPKKRKEVFRLSREEGLKYKEIADRLSISVKTVEAQMGLALKFLRDQLSEFDPRLILFQIFYQSNRGK
jgi:RNA polymerase sigma-70 factor, ECF subfamily